MRERAINRILNLTDNKMPFGIVILRSKTVAISNNSYYSTAIVLTLNMAFEVTKYAQLASLT